LPFSQIQVGLVGLYSFFSIATFLAFHIGHQHAPGPENLSFCVCVGQWLLAHPVTSFSMIGLEFTLQPSILLIAYLLTRELYVAR
jgi:hypothetical protein